ncbi:MAG: cytochrome c biogenesis protein CcdA [Candidatus Aminicenantia bacterium]
MVKRILFLILLISTLNLIGEDMVNCSYYLSQDRFPSGSKGRIAIDCDVKEGYHITDPSLGLLKVEFPKSEIFTFSEPELPKPEPYKDTFILRELKIFSDLRIKENAIPGTFPIEIKLRYQLCEEGIEEKCLLPSIKKINVSIDVVKAGESFNYINKDIFGEKVKVKPSFESFSLLSIIAVFFSGILTGLTPCVYPLYPLVIAFVGGSSIKRKINALFLSFFIILGLSFSFSILGYISARTGSVTGVITHSPLFLILASLIFFLMSLSMFGAFEVRLPSFLLSKFQKKREGVIGAFLMGLIFGMIGIPCVGPLLVSLLTFVAKSQNPILGFLLLFSYALGIGIIFIPLSLFASFGTFLSSTGDISNLIKYFFGLILLASSFYFLNDAIPKNLYFLIIGVTLIFLSVFSGVFRKEEEGVKGKILKGAGVILLTVGLFYLLLSLFLFYNLKIPSSEKVEKTGILWIDSVQEGLNIAEREGKFIIIDFYANWCTVCKELDEKTFSKQEVIESIKDFVKVRIDASKGNPEELTKFNVFGIPTVIFLDSNGNEISRFSGFKNPEEFVREVNKIKLHNL